MTNQDELAVRLYQRPLSVFNVNERKLCYHDFLQAGIYPGCDEAVLKVGNTINEKMEEIYELIATSPITEDDKEFSSFILRERKRAIIDESVKRICDVPASVRASAFRDEYGGI